MSDNTPRRPESKGWLSAPAVTVLLAAVLVGGLWIVNRGITAAPEAAAEQVPSGTAEAWPTMPATFTPMPTATAAAPIPTATPIPVVGVASLNELAVVEYTLTTIAKAESPRDILQGKFGTDAVILKVVGKVKVGIDFTKITSTTTRTSISLTLPPPRVLGVELLPGQSEIVSAQQSWTFSQYPGLETQALEKAKRDLENMVAYNPSMLQVARESAQYKLDRLLRSLGYVNINISSK